MATSNDGLTWTYSDATGISYATNTVGHPAPATALFVSPLGLMMADSTAATAPYYKTQNGIDFTTTPNLGLLAAPNSLAKLSYAYSDTLKRLVLFSVENNNTQLKAGYLDF